MKKGIEGAECVFFEFGLMTFKRAALESALWLPAFMLSLDVRVESRIREVSFTATALEIAAFFILARSARGDLIKLSVCLLLHYDINFKYAATL